MRKLSILGLLILPLVIMVASDASSMPTMTNLYHAKSIWGQQSPPTYGLRLDGFFGGGTNKEVTFAFNDVMFAEYDDGTARLWGDISVAEYDNTGGPGAFGGAWNLDVNFVNAPAGPNASWRYYAIDGSGSHREMTKVGDEANNYADLITYPTDLSKPFQVGYGANGKNGNFGASGWVNFEHYDNGTTYGGLQNHNYSSDFLMDLEAVPEPATVILFGLGLAGAGITRRFRKASK